MAALPEEQAAVAVARAEQVAAVAEDLTAAPTRVQVLVAAVDSAVMAAEVQAAADQECDDCMRALFGSQDLAMVTVGEESCQQMVAATAAVKGQSAEGQQQRRSRRRYRIRNRANGAPSSCVLESGRWTNLPRARRAAADTIAAVQVRKQQQQWRCRFHDVSSGCRRSRYEYAPEGRAPAEGGPDVLDPLVAARLKSLVGLVQAGLAQQQLHQLQLLFQLTQSQ